MTLLAELGLGVVGSEHEMFIPPEFLLANRNARLDLLRGLLGVDEWGESTGPIRFSTDSYRLYERDSRTCSLTWRQCDTRERALVLLQSTK